MDFRWVQVINVHDAINFDIDLGNFEVSDKIVKNFYEYLLLRKDKLSSYSFEELMNKEIKKGISYRCRLRGINKKHGNNKKTLEIKKMMDSVNGQIKCRVREVDIYQRLLVDIIVVKEKPFDLKEYLLKDPSFYPYHFS